MLRGTRLWHYREGKRRTPPTITSAAPTGIAYGVAVNHPYTATGSTPITWSVTAGALPTGLSLNAGTGALTGTPTASGAFSWTVTATNTAGTADQAATATVTYLSKVLSIASLLECWTLTGNSTYLTGQKGSYNLTNDGGTPAGGATVPFAEGGAAILNDGINDYQYSAAVAAAIDQAGFSLMVWVYDASPPAGGYQAYIHTILNANNKAGLWWDQGVGVKLAAVVLRGGSGSVPASGVNLSASTWTCLIGTFAPTETKFYLGGTVYTDAASGSFAGAFTSFYIGQGGGFWVSASMAMVAVFNGVLTAEQVAILATP